MSSPKSKTATAKCSDSTQNELQGQTRSTLYCPHCSVKFINLLELIISHQNSFRVSTTSPQKQKELLICQFTHRNEKPKHKSLKRRKNSLVRHAFIKLREKINTHFDRCSSRCSAKRTKLHLCISGECVCKKKESFETRGYGR